MAAHKHEFRLCDPAATLAMARWPVSLRKRLSALSTLEAATREAQFRQRLAGDMEFAAIAIASRCDAFSAGFAAGWDVAAVKWPEGAPLCTGSQHSIETTSA